MNKQIIILILLFACILIQAQSYEDWNRHSVTEVYKKVELEYGTLNDEGEDIDFVLVETQLDYGVYEVVVGNKVNSTIYQIDGTDIYIKFQFSPFLYKWDEGVFKWDGKYSSCFYEEP